MLEKVISGGQTGVDRAGLDAAMEAGIAVGGYCPKGRLAEDGTVPDCYPLLEMTRGGYPARTEKNVIESDGTLILNIGRVFGGTRVTSDCAHNHDKPCRIVQLDKALQLDDDVRWLREHQIRTLNIAGPRESKYPGIYLEALAYLRQLFGQK